MDGSSARTVRFEELAIQDAQGIEEMSRLASSIVKEYYDPLIGPEQNDYMIALFQSASSIASQLADGFRYFFVVDGAGRRIGYVAFVPHEDSLYLSKFYLCRDQRGQGHARQMMAFVADAAREAGFGAVTLNVNRRNESRFAYEAMGFRIVREEVIDIGQGFVMDDYVYELRLDR